jgi:hypothetical protein
MLHTPFIGVTPYYSQAVNIIILQYVARVTADGGYYEALLCLENKLNALR